MKKILSFIVFTLLVALAVPTAFSAVMPENAPVIGEESKVTDFYSQWQPESFGATRLSDTKVAMALTSGFGQRAGFRTAFDATDFEAEYDMTYMEPGVVAITFFGAPGSYISGNGSFLSIEILKHTTIEGKFLIAVNNAEGAHHESFPEIIVPEQGVWEDSAWKGYIVDALDQTIKIQIKEVGNSVNFTINGDVLVIPSASFYKNFTDKTSAHYSVGALNKDGTVQTLIMDKIFDPARRAYYAEDGTLNNFKEALGLLETALLEDLEVIENVQAAQTLKGNIVTEGLASYDVEFYKNRYESALATLDQAVKALGGDIVLDELEATISQLESLILATTNSTTAQNALSKLDETQEDFSEVDTTEFTQDHLDRLALLEARIDAASDDLDAKIEDLVNSQVEQYENAASDLGSIEKVNAALIAKSNISSNLINLLEEAKKEAMNDRIATVDTLIDTSTKTLEGWSLGSRTHVVTNETDVQATFVGETGLIYGDEKVDLRNFTMSFKIENLTNTTGGWLSFGIMENPEKFINAEDASVQNNKGLFFLIVPLGQGKARVETYLMTLYSNRFFDAQIAENMTIDITKDIEVMFTTELRDVSGVIDEYYKISIGGVSLQTPITVRSLRTSIEDYQGYLNFYGSSGNPQSPNSFVLYSVNGKDATSHDFVKEYLPEPVAYTTELTYQLGQANVSSISFYNRGLDITVKLGETTLTNSDYTYSNNELKINQSIVEALDEGTYTIEVSTAGGAKTVTLTVIQEVVPETPVSNNSVLWIVLGSVAGLAVVGAVVFVIIKRKRVV